jgi:hypothetical protein
MDHFSIPAPGTPHGPCRGSCSHDSCIEKRRLADHRCPVCGIRFGFGTKITGEPPSHLRCVMSETAKHREQESPHHPDHAAHHQAANQPHQVSNLLHPNKDSR